MKGDPAIHTIFHRLHLSRDGGKKQIPRLASDFSLTLESSSIDEKRKKTPKKVVSQRPKTDDYRFNKPAFTFIKPHGHISRYRKCKQACFFIVTSIIQTKPRSTLKDMESAQDQMEDQEKLQMLKDRQGFLRNPRFLPLNAQQGATSLIQPRNKAAHSGTVTSERYSESRLCSRVFACNS